MTPKAAGQIKQLRRRIEELEKLNVQLVGMLADAIDICDEALGHHPVSKARQVSTRRHGLGKVRQWGPASSGMLSER